MTPSADRERRRRMRGAPASADPLECVAPRRAARVRALLAGLPKARPLLVGVSGGRDSVLLLHLLHGAGFREVTVCHLDHRLRGNESHADAAFVRALSRSLGYAALVGRRDVGTLAQRLGVSVETAGRIARHALFARAARVTGARVLLLGHHADDRVETFLFNLFRGAGPKGLSSPRADTSLTLDRLRLRVVRPLLPLFREDIDGAIAAAAIPFREDASNRGLDQARNRIRHELLPAVERTLGRPVRETIWRTAELLAGEEEWIETLVPPSAPNLKTVALRDQPVALQRRTVGAWLRDRAVPDCGFEEIEAVRGLLAADGPARTQLPGGFLAARTAGQIRLVPPRKPMKPVRKRKCRWRTP